MSKRITPLQAVNRIKTDIEISYLPIPNFKDKELYLELLKTIKTELKETEKLRHINCELLEQKNTLREERDKYKKVVEMLKDNISLDFTRYPQSDRYEVWLNNGDEEQILIANTKEDYELLKEIKR